MEESSGLLTEAELELMMLLWGSGGGTVREVLDRLPPDRTRAYTSVATILRILEQKGFVRSVKEGRRHRYIPAIGRAGYEARNLRHLVGGLFGGDPLALVRRLVGTGSLSRDELAAAQALIDQQLQGEEED